MTEALADTIKQMKTEMGMSFGEIGKELRIAKSWAKTVYDKSVKAAESAASTTETEPAF
jgi:hypothetical protein